MSRQQLATHCTIGIDVGGTKCAAGLVEWPDGRILARRLQATEPERGGRAVLAGVLAQVRSLQDEAAQLGVQPIAIGLGVAELVGVDGDVLSAATIDWIGIDVAKHIHAETGLPVTVDADVRVAARAEGRLGAGRELGSYLYVTVGTGISSSLVVKGVPYAGARGLTGTLASSRGLIPSDDGQLVGGPPLEQFAAGPAVRARFAAVCSDRPYTSPEVISLADAGDPLARSIVWSSGQAIGATIAGLVNVLDPEAVVVGGGLGLVEGVFREALDEALRGHIWSEYHRGLPLLSAKFGADAGFIDAALVASDRLLHND